MRLQEKNWRWTALAATVLAACTMTLWLAEPRVAKLWFNTAWLAGTSSLLALPIGTLAALLLFKTDMPGRRAAALLFLAMLFLPLYLVTGAWDAGFGLQGWYTLSAQTPLAREPWLAGWPAAIWIHGLAAVPWVVLIVGAGLRAVEADIEEDAATCASPLRVIWHVTLRRAGPALTVAAVWVAILASTEISVTDFFQVRTFAEEVYTQSALGTVGLITMPNDAALTALPATGLWMGVVVSMLLATLMIGVTSRLIADIVDTPEQAPWICRFKKARWFALLVMLVILMLVAGIPLINLLYKAGIEVLMTEAGRLRTWSAWKALRLTFIVVPREFQNDLWLSTRLAAAAATAALAIGIPCAWIMKKPGLTRWLPLLALAICITIPGPLLGVGLIEILNQSPASPFAFLATLYDSNFAPWLVQTVRALPWATLILWPALASVPQAMLDAAAMEGTGWWGQLIRVAVPQRLPAAAAAWLVGFAIAWGDLGASILVMPPAAGGTTTIAVRIFQMLHYGVDDRAAAISLLMVAGIVTLTAVAVLLILRTRRPAPTEKQAIPLE